MCVICRTCALQEHLHLMKRSKCPAGPSHFLLQSRSLPQRDTKITQKTLASTIWKETRNLSRPFQSFDLKKICKTCLLHLIFKKMKISSQCLWCSASGKAGRLPGASWSKKEKFVMAWQGMNQSGLPSGCPMTSESVLKVHKHIYECWSIQVIDVKVFKAFSVQTLFAIVGFAQEAAKKTWKRIPKSHL